MAREAPVSDSVDPLSGLIGPSLFPRTVRASADVSVPAESKDLDSIHNFMKSLELRSPQKLMSEAKKIVDGGPELVASDLVSCPENLRITNAIAVKGKDKPQERRPGLGRARKRAPFSLKTTVSQTSVNLEPASDIDQLQDPDEYFDAIERTENAKREIQKQLGGNMDSMNHHKSSHKERRRRPGLLGKSYTYKHRFSSTPAENNDMWMSSQQTVYEDIPSAPKDVSQEKSVHPDPDSDADMEEVEMTASSIIKTENKLNDILEGLLSCNQEDLEGLGALNLLQEQLQIKPLDRENQCMSEVPDVGRTNISTASESWRKPCKSSVVINSVLKNRSRKPHKEQELATDAVNPVSSPTPPRSPFASMSLLNKRILQPDPPRDPFSALNIDLSAPPNASPAQPKDRLLRQVDTLKDAGTSNKLESHAEVGNAEPQIPNMDAHEVMGKADSLSQQFVDENASTQPPSADNRPNASPGQPYDKLFGRVDAPADLGMSSELQSHVEVVNREPTISNMDAQEMTRDADSLPEQSEDENASIQNVNADIRPNVSLPEQSEDENASIQNVNVDIRPNEKSNDIGKTTNVFENESNPSIVEEEARDDTSSRRQIDPKQPPEVHPAKSRRGKRVAGEKHIRDAYPRRKNPADESNPCVLEVQARDSTPSRRKIDPEQSPEMHKAKPHGGKRVGGAKRVRDAHPMRKSLAEAGTTFEAGVRRSKRIRMRPLEYWKGERFIFGRVDDSLKLIGVKYFSPGKGTEDLKVKPYIQLEKPEYKNVLDLAARL